MGFLITGRVYYESTTTTEPDSRPTPPPSSHNGGVAPVSGKLRVASGEGLRSKRGNSELRTAGGSALGEVASGGGRLRFGCREAADGGGSAPVGGGLYSRRGSSALRATGGSAPSGGGLWMVGAPLQAAGGSGRRGLRSRWRGAQMVGALLWVVRGCGRREAPLRARRL
ncbi:hypothetical protein GUJ93_ZPchr0013g36820 [Zizania palustris]|uniref:Uncharacterized protein n=1 Tax=Zizania palustris TaxID=103762 RepID=A0A8J5WR78_ZIZPA|nr:hypothetical protein GUJ93_ZPchr0013g36820 [Zizania palustris]